VKKIIRKLLSKFDYRLIKISKNKNSFDIILKILKEKNINSVLDIGANKGQFAAKLRNSGYKNEIISFEPLSKEHELLSQNAIKDDFWKIYPRCAIGNSDGNININISNYSLSSSILNFTDIHKMAKPEAKTIGVENCPIYKLNSIAKELKLYEKDFFMKIDTQGYEKFVIEGASECIKNCKIIFCEVSLKEVYKNQDLWFTIINLLRDKGFEIASIENGVFAEKKNYLLQADIIFIKND